MRLLLPAAVVALLLMSSCTGEPDEVEPSTSSSASASATDETSPEPLAWESEEGLTSLCGGMEGIAALPNAETLEYKVTPVMPVDGRTPSRCSIALTSTAEGAALGEYGSVEISLVNGATYMPEDWGHVWDGAGNGLAFIPEDGARDMELRGEPESWIDPYASAGPVSGHIYYYNFMARIGNVDVQPVISISTTDTSGQLAEDYREDAAVVFDAYMQYLDGTLA